MRISIVAVAVAVVTLAVATYAAYTAVEVADDAGAVSFGTTLDTTLYRNSAGVLKTDGSVQVVQNLNAGSVTAGTTITAGTSLTAGSISTAGTITSTNTGASAISSTGTISSTSGSTSFQGSGNLHLSGYAAAGAGGGAHWFRMKQAGMKLVQSTAQSFTSTGDTMVTFDSGGNNEIPFEAWNVVSGMWPGGGSHYFSAPGGAPGWYHCAGHIHLGGSSTSLISGETVLFRALQLVADYGDGLGLRGMAASSSRAEGVLSLSVSDVIFMNSATKVYLYYSTNATPSGTPLQTCNTRAPVNFGFPGTAITGYKAALSCTYMGES